MLAAAGTGLVQRPGLSTPPSRSRVGRGRPDAGRRRPTAAASSEQPGSEEELPGAKFVKGMLALGAAGLVSAAGVDVVGSNLAAGALGAAESSAVMLGGTAVASAVASAAATLGITKRAEKEQQARQRTRLEKLRAEVVKLQELQGQELALLQAQMNSKAAEFDGAWQRLEDELSQESEERRLLQQQLAVANNKADALDRLVDMEAEERRRLEQLNAMLEAQLESQRAESTALEHAAYDMASRLDAAQGEVAALAAALDAQRSRTTLAEEQWAAGGGGGGAEAAAAAALERENAELRQQLGRAQAESGGLAAKAEEVRAAEARLDEVRASAAAARALLEAAESRAGVLDKAYTVAAQEALQLQTERRKLKAALDDARRRAGVLEGQLEAARALGPQLEAAQAAAAEAQSLLEAAQSRAALLERAWEGANRDATAETAARLEAQRQLEATQRRMRELTADLAFTETSVSSSAAGVEALVDRLNKAMAMAEAPGKSAWEQMNGHASGTAQANGHSYW